MAWISNNKHKIEEKSRKSSRSSSKVVGLALADPWEFQTQFIKMTATRIWQTKINGLAYSYYSNPLKID